MNITQPNKNSKAYQDFLNCIKDKVDVAMEWLNERKIGYVWNNWIDNHLYRLYIPAKDLLLDFEWYPVNNFNYNYIRINYDTDIISVLKRVFPETLLDTQDLGLIVLNQKTANRFFKDNGASPIYGKDVLRLAWYKDTTIYQCVAIRDSRVIANVSSKDAIVKFGTYMILRYLNELYGFESILLKEALDNSFVYTTYQILGLPIDSKTWKKRIWWSANETKWHIKKEQTDQFIPFYFCEDITYKYPS